MTSPAIAGDREIRARVVAGIRADGARVVQEWAIGGSRIDVAAVSANLVGYEIKSDRDSISRLPQQVRDYSDVFDYVWLVAPLKQLGKAQFIVPEWWGRAVVIQEDGQPLRTEIVRQPLINPKCSAQALLQLLWHRELSGLARRYQLPRSVTRARHPMIEALAAELPVVNVRRARS